MKNFFKEHIILVVGLVLVWILTAILQYFFERFFWVGLLVYIPLYFFDRKYSSNWCNSKNVDDLTKNHKFLDTGGMKRPIEKGKGHRGKDRDD